MVFSRLIDEMMLRRVCFLIFVHLGLRGKFLILTSKCQDSPHPLSGLGALLRHLLVLHANPIHYHALYVTKSVWQ